MIRHHVTNYAHTELYVAAQYSIVVSTVVTNIALWLLKLFCMANIEHLEALIFLLKVLNHIYRSKFSLPSIKVNFKNVT